MKIDEKRKVIEVLSIVATKWESLPRHVAEALGYDKAIALISWRRIDAVWGDISLSEACLEAAYRLIESSPTLVREWFRKERGR